jgi:prephenate dehydratase
VGRCMRAKRQQRQTCAACRAIAYANDCGDEVLASAIRLHLPPHTCNAAAAVAADAAAAVAAAAAAEAAEAAALSLKAVDVVAFNKAAETRFVEITKKLVPCPVSHLVRETAYTLDVSVETAKRYLLKHSASNAEFAIVRGIVVLRQKSQVV